MSDTEQSGDDQSPAPEQTAAPEGRLTSYARGHGPDGPVEDNDEIESYGSDEASSAQPVDRVIELLQQISQQLEEGLILLKGKLTT